ncbi:hypothetical protein [Neolewinella persica]|uniref:hypothetical protein n=1 Tax=Neolewinella persica TaxID=70998 RepID=UPI000371933B|nr:hypothetical protein [Neolewinella persica]
MHTPKNVVDLIALNNMFEACQLITRGQVAVSARVQKKLLLLVSRYHDVHDRSIEGTIAHEPYQVEVSQIKKGLLHLLLEKPHSVSDINRPWYHTYWLPLLLASLSVGLLLVLLSGSFFDSPKSTADQELKVPGNGTTTVLPAGLHAQEDTNKEQSVANRSASPPNAPAVQATGGHQETQVPSLPTAEKPKEPLLSTEPTTEGFTVPEEAEKLATLILDVATNHGGDSITLTSTDPLLLYVRLNQPCFVRVIYELATGERILLKDSQEIDESLVSKGVRIGEKPLFAQPPYGQESLIVLAQTSRFQPLKTRTEGAFTYLKTSTKTAINQSRGLVEGNLSTQKILAIKTSK